MYMYVPINKFYLKGEGRGGEGRKGEGRGGEGGAGWYRLITIFILGGYFVL